MYRTPGHKLTGALLFRLYILEKNRAIILCPWTIMNSMLIMLIL